MKKRIPFIIIIIILLVLTGGFFIWKSRKRTSASVGKNAPSHVQGEVKSLDKVISELKSVSVPEPSSLCLVFPFTDENNTITTDSLALWYPALFRISYCPGRIINAAFPARVRSRAYSWKLLKPGKKITSEERKGFLRLFGADIMVNAEVFRKNDRIMANVNITREDSFEIVSEDLSRPASEIRMFPNDIARFVLTTLSPKNLPGKTVKLLEKPLAKNDHNFQWATLASIGYFNGTYRFGDNEYRMLKEDENLDWLAPVYANSFGATDKMISHIKVWRDMYPDNTRFPLLQAGFLNMAGRYGKAVMVSEEFIHEIPGSAKAWEVVAIAVHNIKSPSAAEEYYRKMYKLAPDDFDSNLKMTMFHKDLAWEHRGTGWANTVTQEGWDGFYANLKLAQDYALKSAELNPIDARPWSEMITIAMGQNRSRREL